MPDRSASRPRDPNGFEQAGDTDTGRVTRVFGFIERDAHVRLRGEVVNLVRLDLGEEGHQVRTIAEVAVMKKEFRLSIVRIDVEMVNASRVEGGCPANEAMNLVPLREQQLRQI